jgi:hypothetical protein
MTKAGMKAAFAALSTLCTLGAVGMYSSPAMAAGATPLDLIVTPPAVVANAGSAHVTGVIGGGNATFAPGETVSVTRTTRVGSTDLAAAAIGADGSFAFDDEPGTTGPVTYTVGYAGDDTYAATSGSGKTWERPLAYDFNGDGFAEGVTGSDGEAIGSIKDAGTFYIFPGSAGGFSATGSKSYSQNTTGIPGTSETGDYFGFSQASGDFNKDGYADLAVSSPNEAIGSAKNTGSVTVFYGSPSGLTTTGSFGIDGPAANAYFGQTMAVGDFNGSGADELAIGAPGTTNSGVYLYFSVSSAGVKNINDKQVLSRDDAAGENDDSNTLFGYSLSAADINGDGFTDLAIGSPYDYTDRGYSTGAVFIEYGAINGVGKSSSQRLSLDTPGVTGVPAPFNKDLSDLFGWQVQLGDFNGDGKADVATSAPGAPVTNSSGKHEDAGTASILFSDGSQITSTGNLYLTEDTPGIVGLPGKDDQFGATLAAGDENGDGKADLAIFADSHYVQVIPGGGTTGLNTGHTVAWTQDSPGVPGSDEAGDEWGDFLRFESFQGTGPQGLLIGADGENAGEGAITVLYATSAGLTATGSKGFSQNTAGVPGTSEKGDFMGTFF